MINYLKNMYDIPEDYHYEGTVYPCEIFIDKFSFTDHNGTENIYLIRKGDHNIKISSLEDDINIIFKDSFEFNNFIEKENIPYKRFKECLENEFVSVESGYSTKPSKGGWRNFYSRKNLFCENYVKDEESFILEKGFSYKVRNNNYIDLTTIDEKEAIFMILRIHAKYNIFIPDGRSSSELVRINRLSYKNYSLVTFKYSSGYHSGKYLYMLLESVEYGSYRYDKIIKVSDSIKDVIDDNKFHFTEEENEKYIDFFKYFIKEVLPNTLKKECNKMKLREFEKDGNTYKYSEYNLKQLIKELYYMMKLKGASENE